LRGKKPQQTTKWRRQGRKKSKAQRHEQQQKNEKRSPGKRKLKGKIKKTRKRPSPRHGATKRMGGHRHNTRKTGHSSRKRCELPKDAGKLLGVTRPPLHKSDAEKIMMPWGRGPQQKGKNQGVLIPFGQHNIVGNEKEKPNSDLFLRSCWKMKRLPRCRTNIRGLSEQRVDKAGVKK